MKHWKLILINIVIYLIVICCFAIYTTIEKETVYKSTIHNYENTAYGMEKVITSYMNSEQQLVNSWANSINGSTMTMEEAISFLRTTLGEQKSSAHIVWEDDYSIGLSTQSKSSDKDDYTISYSNESSQLDYESSTNKILDNLISNINLINMTTAYTDPVTGKKVIAFGSRINLFDEGQIRTAFLLYVLPEDFIKEKWIFTAEYENLDIAFIEENGNYIIKSDSMKNTNFYEFIFSYNQIPQESIKEQIFKTLNGNFIALNSKKEKSVFAYAVVGRTGQHAIVLGMPQINIEADPLGWPMIIVTLIALSLSLIANTIFFNLTSKKEHKQLDVIMSQQMQLEKALNDAQHSSNSKTVFLNNMSHDIRTPMNAIIGFTNLALAHITKEDLVKDYLNKIMVSSEHLLSLINDVLDMSRIESGKVRIEEREATLPGILHDLRNILQTDIRAHHLNFNIETSNIVHENVICDKLRLNQILINLMSNATKFTGPGGTVGINVIEKNTAPKGFADFEFHVKDNGIGMSEEFSKHIFEPFTREENSTVSKIQGSGLGMAITKNIVDMMDGNISVKTKQGEGSEFIVALRFKTSSNEIEFKPINYLSGQKALVIIENVESFSGIAKMLESINIQLDYATSGEESVSKINTSLRQSNLYRACIIDSFPYDMSGAELVRKIRNLLGIGVAIIVLSSFDWSSIEDDAKEAGVTAFCSKPLFFSELYSVLKNVDSIQESDKEKKIDENIFIGKKVLLVDDVELNREIAQAILEEMEMKVDTAENGEEAVNKISNSTPGDYDLILMDIMMPVMNGYIATKKIRQLENQTLASIPILAMTANAFEEDRKQAMEAGMNDHLAKPIEVDELKKKMAMLLK